jgi:NAD+ synthase (glutamine-hydrolysing)
LWNDEQFWGQRKYPNNPIAQAQSHRRGSGSQPVGVAVSCAKTADSGGYAGPQCAQRFDVPIVYANQIGANDDLIFDGSSLAVNRQGEVVTRARAFQPDLMWLTYDPQSADLQGGTIAPRSPTSMKKSGQPWY